MGNRKIMTELFRLGELPEGWKENIDGETIDREVGDLLKSDREILSAYKPAAMAREIEARRRGERTVRAKKHVRSAVAALSAAAAMVAFALIMPGLMQDPSRGDLTRMKGRAEAELTLYRNSGLATETLEDRAPAREGDLIQLAYRIDPEMPFGIILSVDGRGVVTRHLAPEGGTAEKLMPGGEQLLDFSYELDDAPRFETFYLLMSDRTFPVDPIVDLLSREARDQDRILDIPEIIRKSSLDSRGIGKIRQYAVSIDKED